MLSCPGQSPAIQFEKSTKNSAPAATGRLCIPIGGGDMTYCPDSGKVYGGSFPIEGRSPDDSVSIPEDDIEDSSANPQITPFPDPPDKRQAPQVSETVEVTLPHRTLTLTIPYGFRLDRVNQARPVPPTAAPASATPDVGLTVRRSTITSTRVVVVTVLGPSPAVPAPTGGYSALLPAPPRATPEPEPSEEEAQMGIPVTPVPDPADNDDNDEEEEEYDDPKVIPVHTTM